MQELRLSRDLFLLLSEEIRAGGHTDHLQHLLGASRRWDLLGLGSCSSVEPVSVHGDPPWALLSRIS